MKFDFNCPKRISDQMTSEYTFWSLLLLGSIFIFFNVNAYSVHLAIFVNYHTISIPFCKHVVLKVTLVPCSVNLTGKWDKAAQRGATINNARIIFKCKTTSLSDSVVN